ncbi:MAG: purine-nucleoside phosphorylase [Thermodesulfatator sp.]|nr:MAG: purine-nucleoside phosphorylase [Thermodesulfatator sp.]
MNKYKEQVEEAVSFLQERLPFEPSVIIMAGTGLGGLARAIDTRLCLSYNEIPNFPISTAPEHAGNLLVGTIGKTRCALFQGRFHYYEGYSTKKLTLPVRVMSLCGSRVMIACNAAGGLNLNFESGDLMLIEDHINLLPDNPLRGENQDEWGPRFPDLSDAYSKPLGNLARTVGGSFGILLREGVFVCVPGPSLETPAETRYLRLIGADAVAMSLVPEVIVARHAGMEVLGISVIANVNDPDNFRPILIEDVIAQAQKAEKNLEKLLQGLLMEYRDEQ